MSQLKLSTEVQITPSGWKINHHSRILTIGSCFSDVLGNRFIDYKFSVLNNPLGTVFNPLAIFKILDSALDERIPNPALFIQNPDHTWLHHDFHSSLWSNDKADLAAHITERTRNVKQFLKETDTLVITLGTAYAYRHKRTNQLIGNCHKVPADHFIKELLHPDQICSAFEQLLQKLQDFRRNLHIVLTVSPVRHTKDTLPLSQVSKATLRLVCHRLSGKYNQVEYFPSYEIMIDELRDYRFYEEDLIHPNRIAEDYIFNSFANAFVDQSALTFMKEWKGICQMLNHHPLHGYTASQFKLLKTLQTRLTALSANVDVSAELKRVEQRLGEFPLR